MQCIERKFNQYCTKKHFNLEVEVSLYLGCFLLKVLVLKPYRNHLKALELKEMEQNPTSNDYLRKKGGRSGTKLLIWISVINY